MDFYLLTGGYVLVGVVGVGTFIWGKGEGTSFYDKAYRIFLQQLPRGCKKLLDKIFGPRVSAALDWAWNYVCFQSNPLVQLFYMMIVIGGYLAFVTWGYPHLPNAYLGRFHKHIGFVVFLNCVWAWWKACVTDPGIVTSKNVEDLIEIYEWDEQIFTTGKCSTCDVLKPARSKHCGMCNVCVTKFDHHCIWINNCVGAGNHKYFLLFLWWHTVICAYGGGLGGTIVWQQIQEKELFKAVFVDPTTRERKPATWLIVIQYMLATEGMVVFVTILCAVMGLVLFGFFMWHMNLVRTGTTTNELSKWNYLKWCLAHEEDGKEKVKALRNLYNKGWKENFREVFVPIDVHRLPRQFAQMAREQKNGVKNGVAAPGKKSGQVQGEVEEGVSGLAP